MKKTILILFAGVLALTSCGSKSTREIKETNEEQVVVTETQETGTIPLTQADFLTKVYNYEKNPQKWTYEGDKPAIIDFYADWCPPCRQIAPILEELAGEYADDIYIYKVNVDNEKELASLFGIQTIPTMLYMPMQGDPQSFAGASSKADINAKIKDILLKQK